MTIFKKINKVSVSCVLYYLGIFVIGLGCTNLFSLQGYLLLVGTVIVAASAILDGGLQFNRKYIVLVLFCFSFFAFSFISGEDRTVRNLLYNFCYYVFMPVVLSAVFFQRSHDRNAKKAAIWSIATGFAVGGWLLIVSTYLYAGNDFDSVIVSFWDNRSISRTGIQLYFVPLFALSFSWFLNVKRCNGLRYWFVFVALMLYDAFVFYYSLEIGNRAIFVSIAAVIVFFFLLLVSKLRSTKIKLAIIVICILMILLIVGMTLGILPMPDFLANIPVIKRFLAGGSNSQRVKLYMQFFANFWRYPFGGTYHAIDDRYVHNFILDIYTFGGIIPFFLFLVLLVWYLCGLKSAEAKYTLGYDGLFLFVGIFAIGMFEPLFEANAFYIPIVCLLFEDIFALIEEPASARPLKINRTYRI